MRTITSPLGLTSLAIVAALAGVDVTGVARALAVLLLAGLAFAKLIGDERLRVRLLPLFCIATVIALFWGGVAHQIRALLWSTISSPVLYAVVGGAGCMALLGGVVASGATALTIRPQGAISASRRTTARRRHIVAPRRVEPFDTAAPSSADEFDFFAQREGSRGP